MSSVPWAVVARARAALPVADLEKHADQAVVPAAYDVGPADRMVPNVARAE